MDIVKVNLKTGIGRPSQARDGGCFLYSIRWVTKALEDEVDRELKDLDDKGTGVGLTASIFWAGRPLYWVITLPLRSPLSALALAVLMILPAFVLGS